MVVSVIDAVRADMQFSHAYARADRGSIGRQKIFLAVLAESFRCPHQSPRQAKQCLWLRPSPADNWPGAPGRPER